MQEVKAQEIMGIQNRIDKHYDDMMDIINKIIEPYCKHLDKYVTFIGGILADGESQPTDAELDDFVLNLSAQIYFASGMCEQLGIKDDISKAIYKEVYNRARSEQASGTVADKDSTAELFSQQEQLTNVCYNRAYKMLKAKIEAAQELLSSCKKVLTRRMAEAELGRQIRQ